MKIGIALFAALLSAGAALHGYGTVHGAKEQLNNKYREN